MIKFEEEVTLEISPVVDVDNILELRYNLSALMSGIRDSDYFSVIIGPNNEAVVEVVDSGLKITHSDGININQHNFSNINEAFNFLQGVEDEWECENLSGRQRELFKVLNKNLNDLSEFILEDEELDELEKIQQSLKLFLSSVEATYSCVDDLEGNYYDPFEDTQ